MSLVTYDAKHFTTILFIIAILIGKLRNLKKVRLWDSKAHTVLLKPTFPCLTFTTPLVGWGRGGDLCDYGRQKLYANIFQAEGRGEDRVSWIPSWNVWVIISEQLYSRGFSRDFYTQTFTRLFPNSSIKWLNSNTSNLLHPTKSKNKEEFQP